MKLLIAFTLLVVCVAQSQSSKQDGLYLNYSLCDDCKYAPGHHTYDVDPNCEHPFYGFRGCPYYRLNRYFPSLRPYSAGCGCSSCAKVVNPYGAPYRTDAYVNSIVF
uniref:Uncharacterized protein n=1 Tax=Anopheles merus TaxID=30066 RepID=A0A2C9H5P7_ANOME